MNSRMNVFVAGVHGVGKSHLASRSAGNLGMQHATSSKLILQESGAANWTDFHRQVTDVDSNQQLLIAAVARINGLGIQLLLDGHFVLLKHGDAFACLDASVFRDLSLRAVVLIEVGLEILVERLDKRGDMSRDREWLREFMQAERDQAQSVCDELGIRLVILNDPDEDDFTNAVQNGWC